MRVLILVVLLLAMSALLQAQFKQIVRAPAPGPPISGSFPAWVIDADGNVRSELYLGEWFYIAFDLRGYTGRLYVVISIDASTLAAGYVDGGYVYGYPVRIVEPVREGKLYTVTIKVYQNNIYLGSATVSYVEKYCPDFDLVDVKWTDFVYNRVSDVSVTLRNRGEAAWTYRVEISSLKGSLKPTTADVTVEAGATATARLQVPVESFRDVSDTMVVRVSCAGGRKSREWTFPITVSPPRPGPIVVNAGVLEAKLEGQSTFSITLKNMGYDAEILSVTLSEGNYRVDAPNKIGTGSEAQATLYFTPTRAGEYDISIRVKYRSPTTGEVYEDSSTIHVKVYALLAVEAVDHLGRPVSITSKIAGTDTNEAWLLPGSYRVEVPAQVALSGNERLTFAGWSTGASTQVVEVRLEKNTRLRAVYNREYKVVVDLSPALPAAERWMREGDVFTHQAPQYVDISQGARWALDGLQLGDRNVGTSLSFTVTGPAVVTSRWHKEYMVTIDCGEARCVEGSTSRSYWVREGDLFSVKLAEVDQVGPRERWRLADPPEIRLTVREPTAVRPRYVKEYYINFGYRILTAEGVEASATVSAQWVQANSQLRLDVERLKPPASTGVKYELAGVEKDGSSTTQDITVTGPHDVYALWDKYYLVNVSTPIGTARGGGWYKAGTYATISLSESVSGFLVYDRFKKWVTNDGREFQEPTVTLKVDKPTVLTAVWEKDYTQALALAGGIAVSGIAYVKRDVIQRTITRTRTKTRRIELEEYQTRTWTQKEEESKK